MTAIFNIGDRVTIQFMPVYRSGEYTDFDLKNKIGTIVDIRNRYQFTPNGYSQYQVHIDGFGLPAKSSLEFLFGENAILLKNEETRHSLKNEEAQNNNKINIGDRVVIIEHRNVAYPTEDYSDNAFSGKFGTVVGIRKRYQDTPNAYCQYQVHIDGYTKPVPHTLCFLFDELSVRPLK